MMQKSSTVSVGYDVSEFSSGMNNKSDSSGDVGKAGSMEGADVVKEAVEQVRQKRPSVRDLASRFEESQGTAPKVAPKEAPEVPPKEAKSIGSDQRDSEEAKPIGTDQRSSEEAKPIGTDQRSSEAEFPELIRILVDLRGRVAGRSKGDLEKAVGMAESLEVTYIQRGTELAEERGEVENLVLHFKQVAIDAKGMLEGIRSVAHAEIEVAKETVRKLQNVLQEHENMWEATDRKKLDELKREARRIKMLHESSTKATDMEHQISTLKQQLVEKAAETAALQKEVEKIKEQGREGAKSPGKSLGYSLAGDEHLGSTLSIVPLNYTALDLAHCAIQWYQMKDDRPTDLLSGAVSPQYAPEPSDVGRMLLAEIKLPGGKTQAVQTSGPIESARGLDKYVEILASKGGAQFNVRIVLKNGDTVEKQQLYTFDVNKSRIKLFKLHTLKAKEIYTSSMRLCGARVGGESAAQGLLWVAKKDQTFMLVLESDRERNAAIMLARKFAKMQNIQLRGPGERTLLKA